MSQTTGGVVWLGQVSDLVHYLSQSQFLSWPGLRGMGLRAAGYKAKKHFATSWTIVAIFKIRTIHALLLFLVFLRKPAALAA